MGTYSLYLSVFIFRSINESYNSVLHGKDYVGRGDVGHVITNRVKHPRTDHRKSRPPMSLEKKNWASLITKINNLECAE